MPWFFSTMSVLLLTNTSLGGSLPELFLRFSTTKYYQDDVTQPFFCPQVERVDGIPILVGLDTKTYYNNSMCVCTTGYFGSNGNCLPCDSNWCTCQTYADSQTSPLFNHMSGCYPVYSSE